MKDELLNDRKRLERIGNEDSSTSLKVRWAARRIAKKVFEVYPRPQNSNERYAQLPLGYSLCYGEFWSGLQNPAMDIIYVEKSWDVLPVCRQPLVSLRAAQAFACEIASGWLHLIAKQIANQYGATAAKTFSREFSL